MSADDELSVFLAEIKDRPEDDTPRLVLADWLQDRGDPRGEFLHLQVLRARLSEGDPGEEEMYRRERLILGRHGLRWLGPLADVAGKWDFFRGFVHLNVRMEHLIDAPDLRGRAELRWLEALTLQTWQGRHLRRLSETGLMGELAWLDVSGSSGASVLRLLEGPDAAGLRTLLMRRTALCDEHLAHLVALPHLAGLRELDLAHNRLGDESALALAAAEHLGGLGRLDVRDNRFTEGGRAALRAAFGERATV